ncbi:MAG: AsmA-like C-terminal region-containing protein [Chryseolinea sp.]
MNKVLKWSLIVLGSLIVLLVAAAVIVPIVFKDDIKRIAQKEIDKSVNAEVVFEGFDLSLFRNFPNVTVQVGNLGVMNREPFAGEMLFATEQLEVEVNLKDILFGDQLRLKGISLQNPVINVKVLKDGRANYDIAVPSADTTTTEESGDFSFGIDHWEIVNGDITYDDESLPFKMSMIGLNHDGSGDFNQNEFDLKTHTVVDSLDVIYDGTAYMSEKKLTLDAIISIAEQYTKYTFKENSAKINDFAMSFDGWFKMNENDYQMDISFKSPDNSFKSLLSVIPGMYTQDFKDIETSGDLAFTGAVKGTYSEKQMPAFNVNLLVKDAMFKYPQLPTAINNINIDLLVDNKDGVIDNTVIDLKKMHLDFGKNPVDAKALITKMYPTNVDAVVNAKLNLAELTSMFPLEGLEMKGAYALDLKAKGVYDSLKKTIPAIEAAMSLNNGYVKSKEFPLPMQDLHFTSTIKNATGRMAETFINVNDLSMVVDNEKFAADLALQNLDDYTWDLKAKGGIDLEKITRIFPVDGMTLAGKVNADIVTKGKYSDLQAERYDKLPTSGKATLTAFKYTAKDLPYEVNLKTASMVFDPKKITLERLEGAIGHSDINVSGSLMNYLGYVLGKDGSIKGNVNFASNYLDLNQFMTSSSTSTTDTASYGVIEIPKNIDFVLNSNIKKTLLMDYTITDATGDIIVRDGIANLSGLHFNMLGGAFVVNGAYNTQDIRHPKYDFGLKIEKLSIREAASKSSLVASYAPIAGLVSGNFSTDFKISGELLSSMMPNLATVNGAGNVKIAQASLKDSKIIAGVTSLTSLKDADQVTMKDVMMATSISNGRLSVKPFDVKFGDYKTSVSGSTGLDKSVDYNLKMDVPAGKLGTEYNALIAKYTGGKTDPNKNIPLTVNIGGKYDAPKINVDMAEQKAQAQEALTNAAKEEGQKQLEKAVKGTEAEKYVKDILGTSKKDSTVVADTTKTAAPSATDEVQKKLEEDAKKKIQNLLKKKNQ